MNSTGVSRAANAATCVLVLVAFASAQTVVPISGNVYDGQGGPLVPGYVYTVSMNGAVFVPAGQTLTMQPGVIIKFAANAYLRVDGTLVAQSPVTFTSVADDTVGGDTNGNGPSTGTPGDWGGVRFQAGSDASTMTGAVVRFAGSSFFSGVLLYQADISLNACTISDCGDRALDLSNSSGGASIVGCSFLNNVGVAVDHVPVDALAGFSGNSASGNGGDYMRCSGTLSTNLTISPNNYVGGALVLSSIFVTPTGTTLTLQPGVVLKSSAPTTYVLVQGTLMALGTAAQPVVMTSFADDDHGGDTNNDGPSSGTPGEWGTVNFAGTSDGSQMQHVLVRYAGGWSGAGVHLSYADVSLVDCVVEHGSTDGIDLGLSRGASLVRCQIANHAGIAVNTVPLDALALFSGNTAVGNGGDYIRAGWGAAASCAITRDAVLGGAIMLENGISVPTGVTLTVGQGVVFKLGPPYGVTCDGALNLMGTSFEPVVFTAKSDDRYGGDTNGDGPSVGSPGAWWGLRYLPAAGTSTLENVIVAYGGHNGQAAFQCASPLVSVRALRVEHVAATGISATALSGDAHDWIAFDCGGTGIQLAGGIFTLAHATSAMNGGPGIDRPYGWTGQVRNSISWGNTPNFSNLGAGQVFYSDGDPVLAGSDGNIHADPLFVDASVSTGDLHLQPGSPCLGAADLVAAFATLKDHDEHPRLLDHDLNGVVDADMGAYELPVWTLAAFGTPTLGSVLTLTTVGPPGNSFYGFGFLDGTVPLPPYGILLAGNIPPLVIVTIPVPVGTPLPLYIPAAPGLVGGAFGVQSLTLPPSSAAVGGLSRLYRAGG